MWTIAALLLTFGMFGGYVAMFRGVFVRAGSRIGWAASYQITMAGLAASRLFAAGGAGGLVLTAWALRRSGMRKRTVADKTISFLVLTYLPYVVAVIVCGFGLHWGLFNGRDPFSLTFVPAVVGVVLLALALAIAFIPTDLQRRLRGFARGGAARPADAQARGRARGDLGRRSATRSTTCARATRRCWARSCSGRSRSPCCGRRSTRSATRRRSPCSCRRSSSACSATCCRCRAASAGSRAAWSARFTAFGVDFDLALVAVLVYRAFTFWLPLVPGVIAYFRLRRTVDGWKQERAASAAA